MGRVIQKDGVHSARYRRFGAGRVSSTKDNDLTVIATRVNRVGTTVLADYASEGLTAAMLTTINTLLTAYKTALENLHDAQANRDIATEARITQANIVYTEMVYLAGVGKSIWQGTDEAKYNDYVIVGSTSVQTHFVNDIAPSARLNITSRTFLPGQQLHIINLANTGLVFDLSINAASVGPNPFTLPPLGESTIAVEVLGPLTNTFLNVQNADPLPGRYDVTIINA